MSAEKRWRLVCYDVRDPKRYRKLFKIVKGAGEPLQYSIFRCRLDESETERLRWRLSQVMDATDSLLIVDLCPSCAHKVVSRNHVEGWTEEPATFRIVGATRKCGDERTTESPRPPDHASASGAGEEGSGTRESAAKSRHERK
jgi:CRISPR-associated protein Cas2